MLGVARISPCIQQSVHRGASDHKYQCDLLVWLHRSYYTKKWAVIQHRSLEDNLTCRHRLLALLSNPDSLSPSTEFDGAQIQATVNSGGWCWNLWNPRSSQNHGLFGRCNTACFHYSRLHDSRCFWQGFWCSFICQHRGTQLDRIKLCCKRLCAES